MDEAIVRRLHNLRKSCGDETLATVATREAISDPTSPLHELTKGFDEERALYDYVYNRVRQVIVKCKIVSEKPSEVIVNAKITRSDGTRGYASTTVGVVTASDKAWWAWVQTKEDQVMAIINNMVADLKKSGGDEYDAVTYVRDEVKRAFVRLYRCKTKAA